MAMEAKKSCENASVKPGVLDPFAVLDLFAALRPATREALKRESRVHAFPKGHIIFMHEDEAAWFYFVQKGWIKLFRETLDGAEAIMDVLPQGSLFGETAAFENGTYAYGAEVIEAASIMAFPLGILEKESQDNSEFSLALLRHISGKGLVRDKEIELRAVQNAAQRIGCFLLRLCKESEGNTVVLHLPWEKSLIAARLGMTPETFSRSLAKLKKEAGLHIRGSTVEISDLGRLVRYTCTACSNVFPCDN